MPGTALSDDGYYTKMTFPGNYDSLREEITVEGWVSLAAYPWGEAQSSKPVTFTIQPRGG